MSTFYKCDRCLKPTEHSTFLRLVDADNITSKVYLDGLKDILLRDDTHEYVSSVTTQSRIDKVNPRVEILITESGVVNRTI